MIAVSSIVLGITLFAQRIAIAMFTAIAAGLIVGAFLSARQHRFDDPLIDLSLFRRPAFSAAIAINRLGFFVSNADWRDGSYSDHEPKLSLAGTPHER
ncbi:MAG: hypothetical protein AB7E55_04885 [Pigmentiphaga sp.]